MTKLFASPELMWEAACEYFEWSDKHPWKKEVLGKGGKWTGEEDEEMATPEVVEMNVKTPYSIHGLCIYLGCSTTYFRTFKLETKAGIKKNGEAFLSVIGAIEDVIYKQQYDGAAAGFFNGNIVSRALGLVEKTEAKTESVVVNIMPSAKEAKEIRKALEKNI